MPYVKRTAAGRISAVFDRPSRDAKERVRANDPELLKFLGLAPTQSVDTPPVDAVLESYDSVEPQIDDPYVPPPAYDDALYDESQVFVNAGEDCTIAFEPEPEPNSPSPTICHTTPSRMMNSMAVLILRASIRNIHGPIIVRPPK